MHPIRGEWLHIFNWVDKPKTEKANNEKPLLIIYLEKNRYYVNLSKLDDFTCVGHWVSCKCSALLHRTSIELLEVFWIDSSTFRSWTFLQRIPCVHLLDLSSPLFAQLRSWGRYSVFFGALIYQYLALFFVPAPCMRFSECEHITYMWLIQSVLHLYYRESRVPSAARHTHWLSRWSESVNKSTPTALPVASRLREA